MKATSTELEPPVVRPREELSGHLGHGCYSGVARASGVSRQHVALSLKGEVGMSFHVAQRVAEAAGVTLDELWHWVSGQPDYRDHGRRTQAAA